MIKVVLVVLFVEKILFRDILGLSLFFIIFMMIR